MEHVLLVMKLGDYKSSIQILKDDAAILDTHIPPDGLKTARYLRELALIALRLHNVKFAEDAIQRSLDIYECTAWDSAELAEALCVQARLCALRARESEGAGAARRAMQIAHRHADSHPLTLARSTLVAGLVALHGESPDEAQKHFQNSCRMFCLAQSPEHPESVEALAYLATAHMHLGQNDEAERLYQDCRKAWEARLGPNHIYVALALHQLGCIGLNRNDYPKARKFFEDSLKALEATVGREHRDYGRGMASLAIAIEESGQGDQGRKMGDQALAILERACGPKDIDLVHTLNSMGVQAERKGRSTEAMALFQRSLEIVEATVGPADRRALAPRENLALVLLKSGQIERAESLYLKNLETAEAKLGPNHASLAPLRRSLAAFCARTKDLAKAVEHQGRAVEILEKVHGPDSVELGEGLSLLSEYQGRREEWATAQALADRSRRILHRHVTGVLPGLPEVEQLRFVNQRDRRTMTQALTLGASGADYPPLRAASAEWLLNSKGIVYEVLGNRVVLARDSKDPVIVSLREQLQECRRKLGGIVTVRDANVPLMDQLRELARLLEQQEQLAERITARVPAPSVPWVSLSEIRETLGPKRALIDVVRLEVPGSGTGEHYFVWFVPPTGNVEIIDLGAASEIDAQITLARAGIAMSTATIEKDEAAAEEQAKNALATLSDLVIRPLESRLTPYDEWLISPDSRLWIAPWSALLLKNRKYVVERHSVRYLTTARELIAKSEPISQRPAVVFANPDYDLGVLAQGRGIGPMGPLPGAEVEAKAVKVRLKRLTGKEPLLLLGREASMQALEKAASPRILLLSTHGYFWGSSSKVSGNPLLFCGLAFAGANRGFIQEIRPAGGPSGEPSGTGGTSAIGASGLAPKTQVLSESSKSVFDRDDGIATGLEILGLDLRGTQIVVLSACDTGKGLIVGGEGVVGLRRAFQLAGAQSVLSTLWPIPEDTAELMGTFFNSLAAGQDEAVALRSAQRAVIQMRRSSKSRGAHPVYWAAFTLTGPPRREARPESVDEGVSATVDRKPDASP